MVILRDVDILDSIVVSQVEVTKKYREISIFKKMGFLFILSFIGLYVLFT